MRTTIALHLMMFFMSTLLIGACTVATDADTQVTLTPDEARSIAKEAFLWGMHPVAIYHLRYNFSLASTA